MQVADRGRPDGLGFHFLILPRSAYLNLGGDPFLLAERFPADWSARDPLPVLSLDDATLPRRTVQELAAALQGPEAGPTLLPAAVTTAAAEAKEAEQQAAKKPADELNVDAVFAKLKTIGGKKADDE